MSYYLGLDIGKEQDRTALAVVERARVLGEWDPVTWARKESTELRVRAVETLPLGTGYGTIVDKTLHRARGLKPRGPVTIVVDATGVGAPVREMLARPENAVRVRGITITAAGVASGCPGGWHVSRNELLTILAVALEKKELALSARMPESKSLAEELRSLRVAQGRVKPASGGHDDRVMAIAIALWVARREGRSMWGTKSLGLEF
jgi:hypothetical protein